MAELPMPPQYPAALNANNPMLAWIYFTQFIYYIFTCVLVEHSRNPWQFTLADIRISPPRTQNNPKILGIKTMSEVKYDKAKVSRHACQHCTKSVQSVDQEESRENSECSPGFIAMIISSSLLRLTPHNVRRV